MLHNLFTATANQQHGVQNCKNEGEFDRQIGKTGLTPQQAGVNPAKTPRNLYTFLKPGNQYRTTSVGYCDAGKGGGREEGKGERGEQWGGELSTDSPVPETP